jgi:hypothetical protein
VSVASWELLIEKVRSVGSDVGDLKVGALEETITVTGETPIVDSPIRQLGDAGLM